jgi:hypothetical protein
LLGVVSVEDDAIEDNGDAFEDDFDDTTNERPTLHSANQCIIDLFRKELPSLVIDTRPAPDILIATVVSRPLKYTSCHSPHDCAEDEKSNCKECVIDRNLFSSSVATSPIIPEDS